jgi:hypothetical protein
MKIILRVTDVLTVLGYRCRDTCQLNPKQIKNSNDKNLKLNHEEHEDTRR